MSSYAYIQHTDDCAARQFIQYAAYNAFQHPKAWSAVCLNKHFARSNRAWMMPDFQDRDDLLNRMNASGAVHVMVEGVSRQARLNNIKRLKQVTQEAPAPWLVRGFFGLIGILLGAVSSFLIKCSLVCVGGVMEGEPFYENNGKESMSLLCFPGAPIVAMQSLCCGGYVGAIAGSELGSLLWHGEFALAWQYTKDVIRADIAPLASIALIPERLELQSYKQMQQINTL